MYRCVYDTNKYVRLTRTFCAKSGLKTDPIATMTRECAIVEHDGWTHVLPYYHKYSTHSKRRFVGQSLLEVYEGEFVQYSAEYFKRAIETGRITVNDRQVTSDYLVKEGDRLDHYVHRHENPVRCTQSTLSVQIIHDDSVILINKPASIPIHPTGRYRHNSLTMIVKRDHHINGFGIHRLDRAVSGLVLMATNTAKAKEICEMIKAGQVSKKYVARVSGRFAYDTITVNVPITAGVKGDLECRVDPTGLVGKPSETIFTFISFDEKSNTSLVRCQPVTGRTHQIRLHLKHVGHPILNDRVYGGEIVESFNMDAIDSSVKHLYQRALDSSPIDETGSDSFKLWRARTRHPTKTTSFIENDKEFDARLVQEAFDHECLECRGVDAYRLSHTNDDETQDGMLGIQRIYLHAYEYAAADGSWCYNVPMPSWTDTVE